MFSIYTTAFLVNKNEFDYQEALFNFCQFAGQDGEVKVAVPTEDEDGTFDTLYKWKEANHPFSANLEIFSYKIEKSNPGFDGELKNAALQECTKEICIGIDLDERLCLWQRERWVELANILLETDHSAVFIPSVDLYKDVNHYRCINHKWYLHKRAGAYRGVVDFGRLDNGHHDIKQSDGCELINKDGKLFHSVMLCNNYNPDFLQANNIPFVFHLGYLDLDNRILRNKNFWKEHWSVEAGEDVYVPLTKEEITDKAIPHTLELWK